MQSWFEPIANTVINNAAARGTWKRVGRRVKRRWEAMESKCLVEDRIGEFGDLGIDGRQDVSGNARGRCGDRAAELLDRQSESAGWG
ncbi:hypothetical protein RSSM_03246 [Rhodopirellula sallentina SM41]|uniref:Uncharacterized protein n=1 Tax=Rhodopirellula sallentina SM41 TaxID=1263870 RepID=M5U209_9BACT|nr:hypothetical protein RSSM_03246 [Rhodopirellula sallentina SM41]